MKNVSKVTKNAVKVAGFMLLAACSAEQRDADNARSGSTGVDLNGAGATFPYPIYSRWFSDYADTTGVKINYQSIGSGGGIRQLLASTVDFAASDVPMTDDELAKSNKGPILHIPTLAGAVVVTYNLPDFTHSLNLSATVISDIFLGEISKWNDKRIAAINPGVTLPENDILVIHRSDGSGTTFIFSDYLASTSEAWRNGPGRGKEIKWLTGLGAKGNEGVAGQVKQLPGSIGYVELAYAVQNGLEFANIENAAGAFVKPSLESVKAAAANTSSNLPEDSDFRVSLVNAQGPDSYPIASFTWFLIYESSLKEESGKKISQFVKWMFTEGKESAEALDYAPLPENIVESINNRIESLSQQ